ncbi:hypothetical protein [Streptomyces sp. NPDC002122]|uniref:hypothetical protein n=1 Tax=Streptomyces sp. NPDC002122 TaxID=3154407 RepID=UPI0033325C07
MTAARRLATTRALLDTPEPTPLPGQLTIPAAALAVIEAALDDSDRLREPLYLQARRVARDLAREGWNFTTPPRRTRRARCPICTTSQLVNTDGHIRRHGALNNACRGSGTPAPTT